MFTLRPFLWRAHLGEVPPSPPAVAGRISISGAALRLGLLMVPLAAGIPGAASAQALGTMQVTALVLPAGPSWAGLTAARTMAREVLSRPSGPVEVRQADVARVQAALASAGGPRRLLITIDYPRN